MDQVKEITEVQIANAIASLKKAHSKTSDDFAITINVNNVEAILNMCIGLNEREITSLLCLLFQMLSIPYLAVISDNLRDTLKYRMYEGV